MFDFARTIIAKESSYCNEIIPRSEAEGPRNPGTYLHIPNHVEQLKTMQAEGIYKKIGLNAHYTDDVISTIEELSPQEKPIKIKK